MPFTCHAERIKLEDNLREAKLHQTGIVEAEAALKNALERPDGPDYPIPNGGIGVTDRDRALANPSAFAANEARNFPGLTPSVPGVIPDAEPGSSFTKKTARVDTSPESTFKSPFYPSTPASPPDPATGKLSGETDAEFRARTNVHDHPKATPKPEPKKPSHDK